MCCPCGLVWFVSCDFLYCIEGYSIAGSCWLVISPNECDWLVVHFTLFTMGEPILLENAWWITFPTVRLSQTCKGYMSGETRWLAIGWHLQDRWRHQLLVSWWIISHQPSAGCIFDDSELVDHEPTINHGHGTSWSINPNCFIQICSV